MLMAEAIIPLYLHSWVRLNKCVLSEVALPPCQVLTAFPPRTFQEIISLSIAALHGRPSGPSRIKHLYSRSLLLSLLLSVENPYPFRKRPAVAINSAAATTTTAAAPCWSGRLATVPNSTIWLNIQRAQGVLHWSNNVQLTESLTNWMSPVGVLSLQNWWTFISTHCLQDGYIKQRLVSRKSGKIITHSRLIDPYQPDVSHKAHR